MPLRGKVESSFKPSRAQWRRWINNQEEAIRLARIVASQAFEAGDRRQCLLTLQLVGQMQGRLLAHLAPKKASAKSKSATGSGSAVSGAEDDAVTASETPDVSKMSDEEVARLAGVEIAPATTQSKPRRPRGRPRGYPVSGAAKIAKARAPERREREAIEHSVNGHIASPAPIPPG